MSTIVAHTFLTHKRRPSMQIAGMLLCAILSDTLNLLGPTTTEWDRLMVAVLADIAHVKNIQMLASRQFKAKSRDLATIDLKRYARAGSRSIRSLWQSRTFHIALKPSLSKQLLGPFFETISTATTKLQPTTFTPTQTFTHTLPTSKTFFHILIMIRRWTH